MSAVFSFDPDEHLAAVTQPAVVIPIAVGMPDAWKDGVQRLQEMPVPSIASAARWHEVVQDAARFAQWHHADAIAAGWKIGEIFGFDARDASCFVGLVIQMRGGRICSISPERIAIDHSNDHTIRRAFFHHDERTDAPPLWELRSR